MPSERYLRNKIRVFELYGIDIKDKKYNCHHQVFRRDIIDGLVPSDYDIDGKANLIPLHIRNEHEPLHRLVEDRQDYNVKKKKRSKFIKNSERSL